MTRCPICKKGQATLKNAARHVMMRHPKQGKVADRLLERAENWKKPKAGQNLKKVAEEIRKGISKVAKIIVEPPVSLQGLMANGSKDVVESLLKKASKLRHEADVIERKVYDFLADAKAHL